MKLMAVALFLVTVMIAGAIAYCPANEVDPTPSYYRLDISVGSNSSNSLREASSSTGEKKVFYEGTPINILYVHVDNVLKKVTPLPKTPIYIEGYSGNERIHSAIMYTGDNGEPASPVLMAGTYLVKCNSIHSVFEVIERPEGMVEKNPETAGIIELALHPLEGRIRGDSEKDKTEEGAEDKAADSPLETEKAPEEGIPHMMRFLLKMFFL